MRTSIVALLVLLTLIPGCTRTPVRETNTDPRSVASIYLQLGINYMAREQYQEALDRFEKALSIDPGSPDVHSVLGIFYHRLGELGKAEKYYKKAITLDPTNSDALNNYGQFLCLQGQTQAAIEHFAEAIKNPLYPTPEVAYTNTAVCLLRGQQVDRAETYLRKALTTNPNVPPALYHMARISYSKRRYLQARGYLQRFIDLAPKDAKILWLGVQIENKLNDLDAAASYGLVLRSQFPDSREAGLLLESEK